MSNSDTNEYVVLIALGVEGDSFEGAQRALMEQLKPLLQSRTPASPVTEWWIAEDERYDGSDNDSAVFIPGYGERTAMSQAEAFETIRNAQNRGDFERIAAILNDRNDVEAVARDLAVYFAMQNPRFDRARFLRACGIEEG